jgi:hypothetical protein
MSSSSHRNLFPNTSPAFGRSFRPMGFVRHAALRCRCAGFSSSAVESCTAPAGCPGMRRPFAAQRGSEYITAWDGLLRFRRQNNRPSRTVSYAPVRWVGPSPCRPLRKGCRPMAGDATSIAHTGSPRIYTHFPLNSRPMITKPSVLRAGRTTFIIPGNTLS